MNYKQDYYEAGQYAKAVDGMITSKKVDHETLYHIICLSVEKYTAALSGMYNYIPMHSGLSFVFRELDKKIQLPAHFIEEVRFLNSFMVYCSLDFIAPKPITEIDVKRMMVFLKELIFFCETKIG